MSSRGESVSESESDEDQVMFACKKCPGKQFSSKDAWRKHKKSKHPKEKQARQAQEEEEEERSIIAGSATSKKPKRRSPRSVQTGPASEVEESEIEAASNLSDSTMDMPESNPDPVVARKRGKPGPRGGKRPVATPTPAAQSPVRSIQTSTRGGKGKGRPGPKSVTRTRIPDWVDSDIFTKKFPGG